MADPKPLASLSAGLLARKGAARPAMRRQAQALGMGPFGAQEDLGWNDMGYDVDPHHGVQDQGRMVDHGLSPMAPAQPALTMPSGEGLSDALDALGQAVDRAMATEVQTSSVEPLDSRVAVPDAATPPAVHEQQLRIEKALGAIEQAVSDAPLPVDPMPEDSFNAIRSAVDAAASPAVRATSAAPEQLNSVRQPRARSRAGSRGSFAFTLRLDPHRHLRLRLASATSNRSAQQIIIQLIDDYLADLPEIDAFAAQVPASTTTN
jgi:hypothetical protein